MEATVDPRQPVSVATPESARSPDESVEVKMEEGVEPLIEPDTSSGISLDATSAFLSEPPVVPVTPATPVIPVAPAPSVAPSSPPRDPDPEPEPDPDPDPVLLPDSVSGTREASLTPAPTEAHIPMSPPISPAPTPTAAEARSAMDAAIAKTLADLEEATHVESGSPRPSLPAEPASDSPMRDLPSASGSPAADQPPRPRQSRFSDAPSASVDLALLDQGRQAALAFAAKTKGGALSRVAQLTARVEKDPLDGEARLALVADAEQKGDLERTREVYEDFLKVFPDAAQQWIGYANVELSHGLFANVEAIFGRCLRLSTAVELWKFYLDYIRRVNPVDPSQGERAKEARAVIAKSFEYALQHVGLDRRAGDMWMEYINFLKEGQNRGTWEDQQRMDALRKAYQRAVCIPLNNVEAIWQEYSQFESNLNKMTAKKFTAELSPSYMTARKALRELRAQFDHLPTPALPHRPIWAHREDRESLELWRRYLAYEEANPLDIEEPAALHTRVAFAYKKAVAHLRFFSEIWYLAAEYNIKVDKTDEARVILQAGMAANPSSLLLAYTLAELEESRQDLVACNQVYDALLDHFQSQLTALDEATQRETAAALEEYDAKMAVDGAANGEDAEGREKTEQEKEQIRTTVQERRQHEVDLAKKSAASVWIAQMRFARRAEGIKQSRAVFAKARRSKYLVWQVVEASAKMELHWNNDPKIATNVFELGLKTFSKDPDYVLQYLDFLIQTNNPNNARALFERTAALVEPSKAQPIWDRMAQYEYQYGDFLAAQKIFTRYSEAFPDAPIMDRFAQRHGCVGLDDALAQDLGISLLETRSRSPSLSRSPSPRRPHKRGPSPGRANYERPGSIDRDFSAGNGVSGDYGQKRLRPNTRVEGSPAPSSNGGWAGGRDEPLIRRPIEHPIHHAPTPPPQLNRPVPFALDPRGDHIAVLPDAVVFFLSILPPAPAFNGPKLDPATIVEVISTTLLPGTAPGPGLPGERLGIPPRQKPNQAQRFHAPPRREPEYGYGARDRGGPARRY